MEWSSICSVEVAQSAAQGHGGMGREREEPDENSSYWKVNIWINNLPLLQPINSSLLKDITWHYSSSFSSYSVNSWLLPDSLTGISMVFKLKGLHFMAEIALEDELIPNSTCWKACLQPLCFSSVSNQAMPLLLPKGCTLCYVEIYSRAQINGDECFYYLLETMQMQSVGYEVREKGFIQQDRIASLGSKSNVGTFPCRYDEERGGPFPPVNMVFRTDGKRPQGSVIIETFLMSRSIIRKKSL